MGWVVGGVWVRSQKQVLHFNRTVWSSYICVQEILVIGLDKPGGAIRHLTNTGVNIRPIPPI